MTTRHALIAILIIVGSSKIANAQSRFQTFDPDKEWTGVEYRLTDFNGAGSGEGKAYILEDEEWSEGVDFTWVVNANGHVEIWFGGTSPSLVFLGGAANEEGDVQGTSNTWQNLDFI